MDAQDAFIRESWVRAMEARLVRDELEKCHKSEGVNHYENCKWLAEKYAGMLKTNKVRVASFCHLEIHTEVASRCRDTGP